MKKSDKEILLEFISLGLGIGMFVVIVFVIAIFFPTYDFPHWIFFILCLIGMLICIGIIRHFILKKFKKEIMTEKEVENEIKYR